MARFSRRKFIQAGTLLGLPASTYRAALLAEDKPSNTPRVGCIGLGGQGTSNMKAVLKNVVALCDVDENHLARAAEIVVKGGTEPAAYGDYRKLLDRKDVDAVLISTPDHWHALTSIHACEAGKDVYCEKPLTLFIREGREMVKAARGNKRVVQTGSQQRSGKEFRQACELVRNGTLGKLTSVKVGLPGPNFKGPAVADAEAPKVLNYDLWLGPAPERAYNEKRVHYLFRFFWDYSGGQQTNFGAHGLDIAQWALGMDDSGPVKIEGSATFNKDKWFETPETAKLEYTYSTGVKVLCSLGAGGYPDGLTFEGEKGTIAVRRGGITMTLNGEKVPDPYALPAGDVKLYVSKGHHADWLECIKTRKNPICDVEIGHRSATVCHLGNIAIRTGKSIVWDPVKEAITNDKDAAPMTSRPYRSPWKLGTSA